jgi:hypothetical protein
MVSVELGHERYVSLTVSRNINGTGPLATNGIEAGVKIRPTEDALLCYRRLVR